MKFYMHFMVMLSLITGITSAQANIHPVELSSEAQNLVDKLAGTGAKYSILRLESQGQNLILIGSPIERFAENIPYKKISKNINPKSYLIGLGFYIACHKLTGVHNTTKLNQEQFQAEQSFSQPFYFEHSLFSTYNPKTKVKKYSKTVFNGAALGLCLMSAGAATRLSNGLLGSDPLERDKQIQENVALHSNISEWILITDESEFLAIQSYLETQLNYTLQ